MAKSYFTPAGTKVGSLAPSKDSSDTSSEKESSGGSSSGKVIRTEVVGNVITQYYEGGGSKTVETTGKVGSASPEAIKKAKVIPKTIATIGDKVYSNVTYTEALRNQLNPNTSAVLNKAKTQMRQSTIRLTTGKGTSYDLINVLSKGTGKVENVSKNIDLAYQLANVNEKQKFRNDALKLLNDNQKAFYEKLPSREKEGYLISVVRRRFQPVQKYLSNEETSFYKSLSPREKEIYLKNRNTRAIQIVKDPFSGKSKLVDYSKAYTSEDVLKFIDKLNENERIRLVQEYLTFKKDIRNKRDIADGLAILLNRGRKEGLKLLKKDDLTKKERFVLDKLGGLFLGFSYGGSQAISGILSPIDALKDVFKIVKTPVASTKQIAKGFKLDPYFQSASFVGSIVTTSALISAGKGVLRLSSSPIGKAIISKSKLVRAIGISSKFKAGTILRTSKGVMGIVLKGGKVLRLPKNITRTFIRTIQSSLNILVDPITEIPKVIIRGLKLGLNISKSPFGLFLKRNAILLSKVPSKTSKLKPGTIIKSKKGILYYVNKKGFIKKVPKIFTSEFLSDLREISPRFKGFAEKGTDFIEIKVGKGKKIKLQVAEKIPGKSIKKQIDLSGKRVNAISSQGQELTNWFKRKRVIRKPIPNEANFSKLTKKLLKKFDEGRASNKDILSLEILINKQGAKGILERAFFADPSGIIRPSRLGTTKLPKLAGFKDVITGNFTIIKPKPQILLFDNILIQKFPKSLDDIVLKIKKGKTLNNIEMNKLINWQVKNKSGKFKPLGFISKESEIVLAPTEIIAYDKTLGFVISKGQKIPIVKAKVIKPRGKIKKLLDDFDNGKLSEPEIKQLEKLILKETKVKYNLQSYSLKKKPYLNLKSYSTKLLSRIVKSKPKVSKPKISKPKLSKPRISKPKVSKPKISKPKLSKPRLSKPKVSKPKISKLEELRKISPKLNWDSKLPRGYNLIVNARYKKGNRIITKQLRTTPNRARKVMNKFIDNNIARSYDLVIIGAKKIKDIQKPSMKKFRVKKGRDPKVRVNVEKVKYALDKPKEKAISRIRRSKRGKKMHKTSLTKQGFKSVIKPKLKKSAKEWAEKWRKKGHNARVVKYKKGYEVYVKRKK